jgi:hypothetical protein
VRLADLHAGRYGSQPRAHGFAENLRVSGSRNGTYQITYLVENLAGNAVDVEFAVDPVVAQQMGGGTRTLKPKDYAKIVVTSPTFPYFVRYPMPVSTPGSQTSLAADSRHPPSPAGTGGTVPRSG